MNTSTEIMYLGLTTEIWDGKLAEQEHIYDSAWGWLKRKKSYDRSWKIGWLRIIEICRTTKNVILQAEGANEPK